MKAMVLNNFVLFLYLDYYKTCQENERDLITLPEIMELRKDTRGLYFGFIEYFVSSVVGKNHYKFNRCDKLLSEFTTVSDEALAILIFENNIVTWKDMASKNITKNSDVIREYTNGGSSKGEVVSSRRYQGWSSTGIKCFNILFDLVKADHNSLHAKSFEESFQFFCINGGVSGKGKKTIAPLYEAVKIRHELWGEPDEPNLCEVAENANSKMQPNHCNSDECNNTAKEEVKEENEDSEDEDPFGSNTKKIAV